MYIVKFSYCNTNANFGKYAYQHWLTIMGNIVRTIYCDPLTCIFRSSVLCCVLFSFFFFFFFILVFYSFLFSRKRLPVQIVDISLNVTTVQPSISILTVLFSNKNQRMRILVYILHNTEK